MKEIALDKPKKTINGITFQLCSFKIIDGHDDSIPFSGNLYANGIKIGEALNDGWGSDASFYRTNAKRNQKFVDEIEAMLKETPIWPDDNRLSEVKYTFGSLCDILAFDMEEYIILKKMKNKNPNNIIFIDKNHTNFVSVNPTDDLNKIISIYKEKGYSYYIK